MSEFLLDSNIIIDFLIGRKNAVLLLNNLKLMDPEPSTSSLCIAEVLLGAKDNEIEKTNLFLNSLKVYDLTRGIADLAGKHIRELRKKGITLNFIDALVASTCIANNLALVTYNIKHYNLSDLEIFDIKDYL